MTHSAIHFALGAAVAAAAWLPAVARNWRAGAPLAEPTGRWLLATYALGLWALLPALLRHAGLPAAWCDGWWMNVFLLHPLLSGLHLGGALVGAAALGAVLLAQYGVVLLALARTSARRNLTAPTPAAPR